MISSEDGHVLSWIYLPSRAEIIATKSFEVWPVQEEDDDGETRRIETPGDFMPGRPLFYSLYAFIEGQGQVCVADSKHMQAVVEYYKRMYIGWEIICNPLPDGVFEQLHPYEQEVYRSYWPEWTPSGIKK